MKYKLNLNEKEKRKTRQLQKIGFFSLKTDFHHER